MSKGSVADPDPRIREHMFGHIRIQGSKAKNGIPNNEDLVCVEEEGDEPGDEDHGHAREEGEHGGQEEAPVLPRQIERMYT